MTTTLQKMYEKRRTNFFVKAREKIKNESALSKRITRPSPNSTTRRKDN
jgi:hypothetical protein